MKRVIFCWLCGLIAALSAEELEIYAYHLGKGLSPQELRSEFLTEDNNWEAILNNEPPTQSLIPKLPGAPFKSRFFKKGDALFDLKWWAQEEVAQGSKIQAAYNQTSGKIVIIGSEEDHVLSLIHISEPTRPY